MNDTRTNRMPAVFVGHGSPMNALEDNAWTRGWESLGARIGKPAAILAVSAHWLTHGTAVTAMEAPPTIHDFGGFPQALFDIQYPAPGSPALAERVRDLLAPLEVMLDDEWGLDHGTWSVLHKMFPQADIPVLQLSMDADQPPSFHLALGERLRPLRDEGVLILATGNVVHNLRTIRWNSKEGYDWAERFNTRIRGLLERGDVAALADTSQWDDDARRAVPTIEHYLPLLYVAGARREDEPFEIVIDGLEMGSISMLSVAAGLPR
ncbi:MAG TPA: 4,5-DOPA dioxygenase extradiol [Noviherbaspirillum sp.]|nr:4,5-DOPA dioxygenase extradiol [Noviherbaspirillum sp.]